MESAPATPFRRRSDSGVVESRERTQISDTHAQIAETLANTELKLRVAAELGTALSERESALLAELDAKNALIDQQLAELGTVHAQREEALARADVAESQVCGVHAFGRLMFASSNFQFRIHHSFTFPAHAPSATHQV